MICGLVAFLFIWLTGLLVSPLIFDILNIKITRCSFGPHKWQLRKCRLREKVYISQGRLMAAVECDICGAIKDIDILQQNVIKKLLCEINANVLYNYILYNYVKTNNVELYPSDTNTYIKLSDDVET